VTRIILDGMLQTLSCANILNKLLHFGISVSVSISTGGRNLGHLLSIFNPCTFAPGAVGPPHILHVRHISKETTSRAKIVKQAAARPKTCYIRLKY
jgi:hypothetical protein